MEHFEFRQPLGGDRESAFVYHSAKRLMFPSLLLARIVYVGLPFSVHSNDLNLPFARLFALAGAGKYAQELTAHRHTRFIFLVFLRACTVGVIERALPALRLERRSPFAPSAPFPLRFVARRGI